MPRLRLAKDSGRYSSGLATRSVCSGNQTSNIRENRYLAERTGGIPQVRHQGE
jgi:hypothetical protein